VAKPPRAAPELAARGGTAVAPCHKGAPCPTGRPAWVRARLCPKPPRRCCPEHRAAARTAIPNAARRAFDFTVAVSSSSARASRVSTPPPRGCVPRSPTCGTRLPPPAWGHLPPSPPCARGSSREWLPPRLASFSSSCSTPRSATDAALAIPSAPLRQARPSRLDAGPSALRRRLRAFVSASGAAHHLLSR
jgi:hypothetical protein